MYISCCVRFIVSYKHSIVDYLFMYYFSISVKVPLSLIDMGLLQYSSLNMSSWAKKINDKKVAISAVEKRLMWVWEGELVSSILFKFVGHCKGHGKYWYQNFVMKFLSYRFLFQVWMSDNSFYFKLQWMTMLKSFHVAVSCAIQIENAVKYNLNSKD